MKNRDLLLLTMGNKYLSTSSLIFTELIQSGNIWISESKEDNYDQITKRSDFNISIPTLFLFYHGLETTIKGILLKIGDNPAEKNHKISFYFNNLKLKLNGNEELLILILGKYIEEEKMNSVLISFLEI